MINDKMTKNPPIMVLKWALTTLMCLIALAGANVFAAQYIDIDDIVPGADAYCLTVLKGTNIEKFPLKVVDVIKNNQPGRNVILVVGTDDRFKHIGPVKGCSGSPVYIDGKIAGALAGGWSFSKDPLYMVTPIKEMLRVSETEQTDASQAAAYNFDFSRPIDLSEVSSVFKKTNTSLNSQQLPLVTSFPQHVCDELSPLFENTSLMPMAAALSSSGSTAGKIEPGSVLAVPFITGDISMAGVGTATEVIDDQVFAFGHSFQGVGFGAVDLPMSSGQVRTVVSNMVISFKLATPGPVIGAIRGNEATGVYGRIGAKPYMIPLKITVDRGGANGPGMKKTYNCMAASNKYFTPLILQSAIMGACLMQGPVGSEHVIEYKINIKLSNGKELRCENVSSGQGFSEVLDDAVSPVLLLMNNPYEESPIASIDLSFKILPESIIARISSMELSETRVKPGQTITASVILNSFRSQKTKQTFELKIPHDAEEKDYSVLVTGGYGFGMYVKGSAPYKFMTTDLDSLVSSIQNILDIKRNSLYLIMPLPSSGIVIKNQPLPYLPQTKTLLFNDKKRTTPIFEQKHWLQKDKKLNYIPTGSKKIIITVEK